MQRPFFFVCYSIFGLGEIIGRTCFNFHKYNLPAVVSNNVNFGFFKVIITLQDPDIIFLEPFYGDIFTAAAQLKVCR